MSIYRAFPQLYILFLLVLLIRAPNNFAQNLIPDGGFESFAVQSCLQPDKQFENLNHWYGLNASPDAFEDDCAYDDTRLFFWDNSIKAFEGNAFIGISSRWNSNGTYVSEGIATQLTRAINCWTSV